MSINPIQHAKNTLHGFFPIFGAVRFGIAGKRMCVIGITGTDGKSSSVVLTAAMLRAAGHKVAHFSSVSFHDGTAERPNNSKMTTPGHMGLHRFLRDAYRSGCSHAVLEITSQGIAQHRHRLIGFTLVGITTITPEHIEAHGGFAEYRAAKLSLLDSLLPQNLGVVVGEATLRDIQGMIPKHIVVRAAGSSGLFAAKVVRESPDGCTLSLSHGTESAEVASTLGGPFAPHNIVFAASLAERLGVSLGAMRAGIESQSAIPGRFEVVARKPRVIVDYAHTLHALSVLLPYVRKETTGKIVHIFGAAGGGRDRYKRPLLAKLSEAYADVHILTEENSFDEPVEDIIAEIRSGFSSHADVKVVPKREEAVRLGFSLLGPDDTLLLTAKGSETVIAGPRRSMRPYNERAYAQCLSEESLSV
jgi:UDP-N-acetylmuramoyl-L-alanyl-D-glutamate--2,6-diaminopimelate ligase